MQTSQDSSLPKKPRREFADAPKRAMEYVNSNRGRVLTAGERLDILSLHANLRADTHAIPRKEPVTGKILRLLGRPSKTVGKIWYNSTAHGSISVADVPANRSERVTKILKPSELRAAVQVSIRKRCESRVRTVCKNVMRFMVEEQFLHVEMADSAQVKTAHDKFSAL